MLNSESTLLTQSLNTILDFQATRQSREIQRPNLPPEVLKDKVDLSLPEQGCSTADIQKLIQNLCAYSVNTAHPFFMNQLYGHIHEMGLVGDFLAAVLNSSMATYEIAPLMTLVETACMQEMGRLIGFDTCDGILTPGGSFSNMQAILLAKDQHFPEARVKGLNGIPPLRIFVSDQAHYSFVKFAQVIGLGQDSVVTVATTDRGTIKPEALKTAIQSEKDKGHIPLMVAATAGTTVAGVYDPLEDLGAIAHAEDLWFHVDGSYGGSLLMVPEYHPYLKGIERADSVAWNPHKMMGVPFHCPALITRHLGALETSLSTDASYLFHNQDKTYDLGHKSLHCGRRMEALKLWLSWKYYGREGLGQRIQAMVTAARSFAQAVKERPDFELHHEPEAPIVLFQYAPAGVSPDALNRFNQEIREVIFARGRLVMNYAHIADKIVLRCVISNPEFKSVHAQEILDTVEAVGQDIKASYR